LIAAGTVVLWLAASVQFVPPWHDPYSWW